MSHTGDTIISGNTLSQQLQKAFKAVEKSGNATIFVSKDTDAEQYGKVIGNKTVVGEYDDYYYRSITELYVFLKGIAEKASMIQPSERGLIEITLVSQLYQEDNKLQIQELASDCDWLDTNTFDSLVRCNNFMQKRSKHL